MAIRSIVFDFDGVLVESVAVKLGAYVALFEGEPGDTPARVHAFCRSHIGLSRFQLLEAIHREVLRRPLPPVALASLCQRFSDLVMDRVVAAASVPGADEFLSQYAHRYRFFIVSATPEVELHEILRRRQIAHCFEGAFGSPEPKEALLQGLLASSGLRADELVYVGDSERDWAAVRSLEIPFIWRRSTPDEQLAGDYRGPAIDTLEGLPACLAQMAAARGPTQV